MGSLIDILCSEQHAEEPVARQAPAGDSALGASAKAADDKGGLGKPPFPLSGARRKSGWGKRFKEREQGRLAIIFPRRKMGEAARGSDAVWLSVEVLNSLADRSLASAAKLLVSRVATSAATACGVRRAACGVVLRRGSPAFQARPCCAHPCP
jgi:hypothetical protein